MSGLSRRRRGSAGKAFADPMPSTGPRMALHSCPCGGFWVPMSAVMGCKLPPGRGESLSVMAVISRSSGEGSGWELSASTLPAAGDEGLRPGVEVGRGSARECPLLYGRRWPQNKQRLSDH